MALTRVTINAICAMEQHTAAKEQTVNRFQTVLQDMKDKENHRAPNVKQDLNFQMALVPLAQETHSATMD